MKYWVVKWILVGHLKPPSLIRLKRVLPTPFFTFITHSGQLIENCYLTILFQPDEWINGVKIYKQKKQLQIWIDEHLSSSTRTGKKDEKKYNDINEKNSMFRWLISSCYRNTTTTIIFSNAKDIDTFVHSLWRPFLNKIKNDYHSMNDQ